MKAVLDSGASISIINKDLVDAKEVSEGEEIESMKKNGVIRESSSPFASPIILVPKPNGARRRLENMHEDSEEALLAEVASRCEKNT